MRARIIIAEAVKSVSAKLLHLEAYTRSRGHIKQIHDRNFNLLGSVTVEPFTPFLEPTLNLFAANRRRSQVNSNMTSRTDAQRVPQGIFSLSPPASGLHLTRARVRGAWGCARARACVHQFVSARNNRFNASKVHISMLIVGLSVCGNSRIFPFLSLASSFPRAWRAP